MPETIHISVAEVVGSCLCVASRDGALVCARVADGLRRKCPVELSFEGTTAITSAFLNAAIGRLYGRFDGALVDSLLRVQDMQRSDRLLLRRVVGRAKQYYGSFSPDASGDGDGMVRDRVYV